MCQFFSAGQDNSLELDETGSGNDNDDAKNEGGQVGTTGQEMGEFHPPI